MDLEGGDARNVPQQWWTHKMKPFIFTKNDEQKRTAKDGWIIVEPLT